MAINLEIVTPESKVFSDEVANVYLPGADGEIGVLTLHEALVTALKAGELRYEKEGRTTPMAIGGGFAEITPHAVRVLTDSAEKADEIDRAVAEEAVERARQRLEGLDVATDSEEYRRTQELVMKHEARLRLFDKVKG